MPYLRHRWALAGVLGVDEATYGRSCGLPGHGRRKALAIYPHRDVVPRDLWLRLFGSARKEVGILKCNGYFLPRIRAS